MDDRPLATPANADPKLAETAWRLPADGHDRALLGRFAPILARHLGRSVSEEEALALALSFAEERLARRSRDPLLARAARASGATVLRIALGTCVLDPEGFLGHAKRLEKGRAP